MTGKGNISCWACGADSFVFCNGHVIDGKLVSAVQLLQDKKWKQISYDYVHKWECPECQQFRRRFASFCKEGGVHVVFPFYPYPS